MDRHCDEDEESSRNLQRSRTGCYKFIGIKSHLHHFYDYGGKTDTEEDEARNYLLQPKKTKRCSPVLWKIILWFGINSLVFGAILILISHFTPRRDLLHPMTATGTFAIVDKRASRVNTALDILGTVGIVSFVMAGVLIIIAVLLPTYFNEYCFEDRDVGSTDSDESMCGHVGDNHSHLPTSPVDQTVPATQLIQGVQPQRKANESAIPTSYQRIE